MTLTPSPKFTVADGRFYNVHASGTHYHPDTTEDVVNALEKARRNKTKIRIFLGDADGVSWHDENDVTGLIGRSMGPCHVPLLLSSAKSDGGHHLLDHRIIGILTKNDAWLYKHPSLDLGEWTVAPDPDKTPKLPFATFVNGALYGRHATMEKAERLVSFMTAKRLTA